MKYRISDQAIDYYVEWHKPGYVVSQQSHLNVCCNIIQERESVLSYGKHKLPKGHLMEVGPKR